MNKDRIIEAPLEEKLGYKLREVIRQIVKEELDKVLEGKSLEADLQMTKAALWKQWQDHLRFYGKVVE